MKIKDFSCDLFVTECDRKIILKSQNESQINRPKNFVTSKVTAKVTAKITFGHFEVTNKSQKERETTNEKSRFIC